MDLLKNWFLKLFYYLVGPLILVSYLLEPFTVDARIYLGVAKITALTPGFPMNLDAVWESRFIGHRFLYYILNMISPFDGWFYSIWMKFIVAIFTILVLYYFSERVSERMQISIHYPFILGFFGLFAINSFVIFSSEYFSVVIGMIMLICLLDHRKWLWFCSGLLVLPIFLLKGLPVLVVVIVLLTLMLLIPDYKPRVYAALISIPVTGAALLALAIYFPHFISDFYLASKIAHIIIPDPSQILYFIGYFFVYLGVSGVTIPIVLIGIFSFVGIFLVSQKLNVYDIGLLLMMWLISSAYVLIIREFLYYHYFMMLIPAIITICYFLKVYKKSIPAFIVIILLVPVVFAAAVSGWSVGMAFVDYNYWSTIETKAEHITSTYDIMTQPTTLYLDPGYATYYFPTRSACRYVNPAPLQRNSPEWDMTGTVGYGEMMNCSMNYTGKYVIVEPTWFDLSLNPELSDKLHKEYTMIYSDFWDIYQRTELGVV